MQTNPTPEPCRDEAVKLSAEHVVSGARLTPEYLAMTALEKWETLALSGLLGTDEPWIEDMRQSLKALSSREQGSHCENCLRPVEVGQVVLPWEEPGEMHADCDHPFSLNVTRHDDEPAPVVLLGEPMIHVPLDALSSLPVSGEVERLRKALKSIAGGGTHSRLLFEARMRGKRSLTWHAVNVLQDGIAAAEGTAEAALNPQPQEGE